MRGLRHIWAVVVLSGFGTLAAAQEQTLVVPSPIMVVDFEQLVRATQYGQRINLDITAERTRVQAENDRIAAELRAEEAALTQSRATMEPAAFREAARDFNDRAQEVRRVREAENAKLLQLRDDARAQFLERIQPIVLALMLERGAVVTMDRRAVYLAIGSSNATADAVALINQTLGDGQQMPDERPNLRPFGVPVPAPVVPQVQQPDTGPADDGLLQTE